MGLNELPVVGEQRVDMPVVNGPAWTEEGQILPVADARHELDAGQVGKSEDRRRLRLGITMKGGRLEVRCALSRPSTM